MKKESTNRLLSLLLSCVMILNLLPVAALGVDIRQEWIAEFADSTTARDCADEAGGTYLGGPFALLCASKAELDCYPVLSLTENSMVEGSGVDQPSDERAAEQYILTHKSWYGQDAWAALESFLTSRTTPLTPADCNTVRVAVIDSGIDATHEDLSARVTAGWDAVSGTPIAEGVNSDVSIDSHGTKVAGLIGAASDNEIGIAGAAWTFPVELIPVRVLNSSNKGTMADVVAAIYWAVDEGDADILNLSFGQTARSIPTAMQAAVLHAVEEGVIVVAAAGNNGEYHDSDHYYPASLDGVLPVGSTAETLGRSYGNYDKYVQKAEFSNWPYYETDCGKTFFFTPGENLLTTSAGNSYESFTGTSASAAMFSGMLAALKSCADTTGQPAVENYLSYNKYSYLGGLYYQDYKYMVDALVAGYTSGDVRFDFDDHLPDTLRGTVELSGILNDPALRYSEIHLSIEDVLVDTAIRTETAKQYISFAVDTTAFEDDYYYPSKIILTGVLEDGSEEKIDHSHGFEINNNSEFYTVAVASGGEPLVAAAGYLFNDNGSLVYTYSTDNLGQIYLGPDDADGESSLLVLGEELLVWRKLTPYPAGNRYSFGNDPALLTICCSGDILAAVDGAVICASMPDGEQYEVGTIIGDETEIWVDTDSPITFTVCGTGTILTETVDLSGDDVLWDLDSTETASITLIHDGQAPTEGTAGPVRFLGLEIDGFGEQLLDADGGSILVPPGEYSVTGYVYWWDGNYYSNYAKVDLGTHDVTEEGLTLTLGSGTPSPSLAVSTETVIEGQSVSVTLNFTDSYGNTIAEMGGSDAECSYREKYRYAYLNIEEYDAESENWNQIGVTNLYNVPGSGSVSGSQLGTQPGQRRIIFLGEDFISGMANAAAEFTLVPQETRPAATVQISLLDSYGNNMYDVSAATVLTDSEGNTIVREAYPSEYGDESIIKLPIGETYFLAVMALDYSTAYLTSCAVDLTETVDGEEVPVSLTADDSWIVHEIPMPEYEEGYIYVRNLACAAFEDVPTYRLTGAGTNGHIDTLYTAGLTETELYFDVMPDGYEMENYEYPPVFTMKQEADLSEANTLEVGLPETLTLTIETDADKATLTPVITDVYGNEMTGATYASRYGDMGDIEGGGDVPVEEPVMVYPAVTVYNGEGEKIFRENTAFLPLTVEGLGEGVYAATIEWQSSDIHMTGEQINFTIGAGGEEPPAIPTLQVPTNFRAAVADGVVSLSWAAPLNGCTGYLLLRDGETLANLNGGAVTYTDDDASSGGYHMYTLYAIDEEGRRSEAVTAGAAIAAGDDTEAPVWGSGAELKAEIGEGGVNLSWSRAQDTGSGVTGYLLLCNGEQVAQLFTRRYTYSAIQPNTDYVFSVKAVDGAGNVSDVLTADAVSVSSGILGVELDYARNRLGYITGKSLSIQVKTTADLESVSITVDYTEGDGSTGTLTPDVTGTGGSFAANLSLSDDFAQVDQVMVTGGGDAYRCLDDPILRCFSHVEVEVDLSDAAALYPSAVLTLYAPSVGYAYSWLVTDMAAVIDENVIAAADYRLTLADSNGNVLLTREADLSADAQITLGAEDVRFLQLTVAGGFAGLMVTVVSDGRTVSGKLDESGTATWGSGGRFLPVGSGGTVNIPELEYSEELTFDKVINQKTVQPEALEYEPVSVTVTVLDTEGKGISGVEVLLTGHNASATGITGPDGSCVISIVNRKDNIPMVSMAQQRDDQDRIWTHVSNWAPNGAASLWPTQLYDQIVVRPVLDMDVDMERVSFTVNGQPAVLRDGLLRFSDSGKLWRESERFYVTAECEMGGKVYSAKTYSNMEPGTSGQTVALALKRHVDVTLSLTDDGDVMQGKKRYFAVFDEDLDLVASLSTYDSEVTVSLIEGERYSIVGSWEQIVLQWNSGYTAARTEVTAREGLQVPLSLACFGISQFLFDQAFFRQNGINRHTVSLDRKGDIRVQLLIAEGTVGNPNVTQAHNEIILPAGAENVRYYSEEVDIDPDTNTVRLLTDLTEQTMRGGGTLYFTIPAERLDPDAEILFNLVFTYEGTVYRRTGNRLTLGEILMEVTAPDRIYRSELSASGVTAEVFLPCVSTGKLELYEGDQLLAACATKAQQRSYQLQIHPTATLGEHTIRVVYTADSGLTLAREIVCEAVEEGRPALLSAEIFLNGVSSGDLLKADIFRYYTADLTDSVSCEATFSNRDKVERVWLCGETASEFDRIELFWEPERNAYYGMGQLGDMASPFNALWIEFEETTLTADETADEVRGELSVDYDFTYTPEEIPDTPYSYAPDPDLGEAVQAQAISDWEKYINLVRDGLYEREGEDTVAALEELFGEDKVWELPAVTDGEDYFSMNYGFDPDTVAAKLSSTEAFTVKINGEERKVLIELVMEGDDLYICYYGLGDLFIPAVPEDDEPVMTAAGSLIGGLKDFAKRHWKEGMKIRQKYNEYKWIGQGLQEELNKEPEDPNEGSGDPCSSGSGTGGQTREQRRQQIDNTFNEGWEAAKAVGSGISKAGGAMGLGTTMFGSHLTKDGSVMHAMFEMQKQRIHQIDDILDELDEDAFADEPADPCDGSEDGKDAEDKPGAKKRYRNGYRKFWTKALIDPSGYIYEGAPGYPAVGVNAYLYYLEEDGETWTLWNSEDFGQGPNPYPSEENGYYGWDVLPGKWKVVFEGEGYANAESVELDVPPPHLDVDVSLTSTRNPKILDASVKADGSIYLKFDHLMTTESVLYNAVTVTLGDEVLTGSLEAVDQKETTIGIKQAALSTNVQAGLEVASVFRFVPDDAILAGMTVEVTVDGSVLGYNGLPMLGVWSDRLIVPEQDAALTLLSVERVREDGIYLQISDSYTLNADDWYAVYSDGFGAEEERTDIDIEWYSSDESVAIVDEAGKITAVGGGIASIIGKLDGYTIAFGVSVTRAPIRADADENDVRFCRDLNLVLGKACYMWSSAANFRLDDPMDGDEKYMPAAWRIKESGSIQAQGTVSDGETSVKIIYTPTALGTLTGEIDYQKYVYTGGRWVASGSPETAVRNIPVTEVTGLTLHTAPKTANPGEVLDLSAMRIGISLSDNSVSTVTYDKLASYGIAMNLNHGDTLGVSDTRLILTHERTGIELQIDLGFGTETEPVSVRWDDDVCTVERQVFENGIIVIAAAYENGKLVKAEYLTVSDHTATLTGDEVKVFFLKDGSYAPDRDIVEKQKP